jgi:hypothetical protein
MQLREQGFVLLPVVRDMCMMLSVYGVLWLQLSIILFGAHLLAQINHIDKIDEYYTSGRILINVVDAKHEQPLRIRLVYYCLIDELVEKL